MISDKPLEAGHRSDLVLPIFIDPLLRAIDPFFAVQPPNMVTDSTVANPFPPSFRIVKSHLTNQIVPTTEHCLPLLTFQVLNFDPKALLEADLTLFRLSVGEFVVLKNVLVFDREVLRVKSCESLLKERLMRLNANDFGNLSSI